MNPSDHEWRVWVFTGTGFYARYFPDEDAARVFAIKIGAARVEHAPINF